MAQTSKFPNVLLLLAFFVDLLTPTLIWKGIIPGNLRWISEGAIAVMIAVIPLRMLIFKKIPFSFWVILFLSLTGIITALFTGQGLAATIWGWWVMFQFPLVGLFAYLQPTWPKSFSKYLVWVCLAIILFEVVFQVGQYLTRTPPGDQLGGTFGQNGTGNLVLFLLLVLCFTLGGLLYTHNWIPLVLALVLGMISSVLGEMKLFYGMVFVLGILTMIIYAALGKQLWRLIPVTILFLLILAVFVPVYDAVVPGANELPLEGYMTNTDLLTKYLNLRTQEVSGQNYYYDLGRNLAVQYGWEKITADPISFTLGYGLGARSESTSLGIVGRALLEGNLGVTSGTSALVIMQETGMLGILVLGGFILASVISLFRQIHQHPESNANSLRYGLILFTLLLPFWLWYDSSWAAGVAMLLYWSVLGFVTNENERQTAVMLLESSDLKTLPVSLQLQA